MALIRNFTRMSNQGSVHQTETAAGWAEVGPSGQPLLYLATYGSTERQSGPKPSQVIHLDRAGAAELVRIIHEVFPDLEA